MHSGGEQREVPGVSRSRVARIREELWTVKCSAVGAWVVTFSRALS